MKALGNPQLVDVPNSEKTNCTDKFWEVLNRAPDYILAELHSKGSHTGNGTTWAGSYQTFEIFDGRRPDWPTEEVEKWAKELEWSIIECVGQQTKNKVR